MIAPMLEKLASLGVVVDLDGGDLRLRAPRGVLTADVKAEVRAHREELCAALAPSTPSSTPEALGAQLLAHLEGADVRISLFDDGGLGWDAPPDYMTPQLRAAVAEAAPEILAELRRCGRKAIPRWICLAELDPARYARPSPPLPSAPPLTPERGNTSSALHRGAS